MFLGTPGPTCKVNNALEKGLKAKPLSTTQEKEKLEIINAKDVTSRFIILI